MSTDKIYEFLPGNLKNAIINVRDFKNPQELAEHLKFFINNETEYNKHLEWKTKGLGDINDTVIGNTGTDNFITGVKYARASLRGNGMKRD